MPLPVKAVTSAQFIGPRRHLDARGLAPAVRVGFKRENA